MIKTIQNTSKYSLDNFDLHFYFDDTVTNSTSKIYNDDGLLNNAFEKGQYELLNFSSNNSNKTLTLKLAAEIGKNYQASDKNVSLLIHNIQPKRVFVNGNEILFKKFNEPLQVPVSWEKGSVQEIKIQY
jgi:hypothetical protein